MTSEYKYKIGEIVYDKVRPHQKLIVDKIIGNVYYCKDAENVRVTSQVYFEKDLNGPDS